MFAKLSNSKGVLTPTSHSFTSVLEKHEENLSFVKILTPVDTLVITPGLLANSESFLWWSLSQTELRYPSEGNEECWLHSIIWLMFEPCCC